MMSQHGSFSTPSYPESYPPWTVCEWLVRASAGNRVQLSFQQFDIEDSDNCNADYVEVPLSLSPERYARLLPAFTGFYRVLGLGFYRFFFVGVPDPRGGQQRDPAGPLLRRPGGQHHRPVGQHALGPLPQRRRRHRRRIARRLHLRYLERLISSVSVQSSD